MEYVQKHKVPIVIDINSNTWNIKEIIDMLRENNDINLIYPKNLFSALQNVKKHLQINYNISEIVYQENPLELSSIYKTKNNLLIVISEDSHHFLLELSERSDFNTCIFVITDKQKSLKPLLLDVIPIFLLPPDTDEWLMEFNFALQCLTLRKRIEFSKSKKDNYIELCYTYRKLGDLYDKNGYTAQAAKSYSTARRIAQENENWELANFYFSNFEEDLHFELRGSTIIYSLSDYLNNTKI